MYFDGGSDGISRKAIRGRWGLLGDRQLLFFGEFQKIHSDK